MSHESQEPWLRDESFLVVSCVAHHRRMAPWRAGVPYMVGGAAEQAMIRHTTDMRRAARATDHEHITYVIHCTIPYHAYAAYACSLESKRVYSL